MNILEEKLLERIQAMLSDVFLFFICRLTGVKLSLIRHSWLRAIFKSIFLFSAIE
jgi:hypothetical protein